NLAVWVCRGAGGLGRNPSRAECADDVFYLTRLAVDEPGAARRSGMAAGRRVARPCRGFGNHRRDATRVVRRCLRSDLEPNANYRGGLLPQPAPSYDAARRL